MPYWLWSFFRRHTFFLSTTCPIFFRLCILYFPIHEKWCYTQPNSYYLFIDYATFDVVVYSCVFSFRPHTDNHFVESVWNLNERQAIYTNISEAKTIRIRVRTSDFILHLHFNGKMRGKAKEKHIFIYPQFTYILSEREKKKKKRLTMRYITFSTGWLLGIFSFNSQKVYYWTASRKKERHELFFQIII